MSSLYFVENIRLTEYNRLVAVKTQLKSKESILVFHILSEIA